jgi:hypothetical protein
MYVRWASRNRDRKSGGALIAQLVESKSIDGKSRKRVLAHLGTCHFGYRNSRSCRSPHSCAVGGPGAGFFGFPELVEEAASLLFVGGVPPFNKREAVGAAEGGHQDSPLAPPLRAILIAEGRDADGELGLDFGAIFGREGHAVERLFAALVEPEAVAQRVDRLAAGAEVGKDALAGLAVDAFAFDKLGDEHATTFVVAVDPPDEHASWIPEKGCRRFG